MDDTEAWEAAGLYGPQDPEAPERLALLRYLTERGATVDQMVEAHRLGALPAVAGDLVKEAHPSTRSIGEVAARCGVPVPRVQRVLLSLGVPVTPESTLPEDIEALMAAFERGAALMGDEALFAFVRVLGAAASNVAEAAVALFYDRLGPGAEGEGTDELARARTSERATLAFAAVPEVLRRALLVHFDRAGDRALRSRGWGEVRGARREADDPAVGGVPGGGEVAGGEFVALGFVDLVGSTSWAERVNLREHSLALSRFESAAWSHAVLAGGRVVKMIGDEVFYSAPTVDAACRIGLDVCASVASDELLPPARGAVGYGVATPREGDYFGPLVNQVSRLVKVASPGTLVVNEEAARVLAPGAWALRELEPPRLLAGIGPVRVFATTPAG